MLQEHLSSLRTAPPLAPISLGSCCPTPAPPPCPHPTSSPTQSHRIPGFSTHPAQEEPSSRLGLFWGHKSLLKPRVKTFSFSPPRTQRDLAIPALSWSIIHPLQQPIRNFPVPTSLSTKTLSETQNSATIPHFSAPNQPCPVWDRFLPEPPWNDPWGGIIPDKPPHAQGTTYARSFLRALSAFSLWMCSMRIRLFLNTLPLTFR